MKRSAGDLFFDAYDQVRIREIHGDEMIVSGNIRAQEQRPPSLDKELIPGQIARAVVKQTLVAEDE